MSGRKQRRNWEGWETERRYIAVVDSELGLATRKSQIQGKQEFSEDPMRMTSQKNTTQELEPIETLSNG